MFTKLEQHSWIKIEVARDPSKQECFQGLCEACGNPALPYRTVALWVKTFREGRDAVQDNLHIGQPHSSTPCFLLDADGLCNQCRSGVTWIGCPMEIVRKVLRFILHWFEYVTKLCSTFWITANLQHVGYPMKFPRCNNGTTMQSNRPCWTGSKGKVTTFLEESLLWTKPGLTHMNQTWNANQMNRNILVLLVQRRCALHNMLFIVEYDIDGVILHHAVPPRQMVNAANYCMFLQHHLCPVLRRKHLWYRITSFFMTIKESYRCCCHRSLALLAMGDSRTILTQYESMQLRSLHQSERTTVRDPVQLKRWTYLWYRAVNTEHNQWWMR